MAVRLDAVTFDVPDAFAVARFWAGLLDRDVLGESDSAFLPGDRTQVGLSFVGGATAQLARPLLHLHLTSSSRADQQRTVEKALRLGGRHLDVGQAADDDFVVLADPGGNELCVIEPGNGFLAGTGVLGEVTRDGSRQAGMFWRDALGWPLVWDEGEQLAIQSPFGGTKISWDAWDGRSPAMAHSGTRQRQRFDLVADDLAKETERLVALGASRLGSLPGGVELADPDGNEFALKYALNTR